MSKENACGHIPVNLIAGAEIKILNHIYLLFNHNIEFKVNVKDSCHGTGKKGYSLHDIANMKDLKHQFTIVTLTNDNTLGLYIYSTCMIEWLQSRI